MIPWQTLDPASLGRADTMEVPDSGDPGEDQDQEDHGDPGGDTGAPGLQVTQEG